MFAPGAFIGALLQLGLHVDKSLGVNDFIKLAGFVITSTLTGPVFTWIGKLGGATTLGDALLAYPTGLFCAILWFYVRLSLPKLDSPNSSVAVVAGLHIATIVAISLMS